MKRVSIYRIDLTKRVTEYSLYRDGRHPKNYLESEEYLWKIEIYDSRDEPVKTETHSKSGKIMEELQNIYDKENRIIKSIRNGDSFAVTIISEYEYSPDNQMVIKTEFFGEQLNAKVITQKNKSGDIISVESYDWNDTLTNKIINQFDETDMLLHFYEYDGDGNELYRTDYTHEANGKITTETDYYDGVECKSIFKYKGDKLIRIEWQRRKDHGTEIYNYDSSGN